MDLQSNPALDLIAFQINRKTSEMAKSFLNIVEDLIADGYKIEDDKYKRIRKRVLDSKGNADRELQLTLDKLDISFK